MKRNKFLISTVLEKQDIPSDYCSKLGSEHWRLDRITWDLCAEDCSKSFKTKNHVTSYALFTQIYNIFCPQRCVEYVEISLPASLPFWIVRSLSIHPEPQSKQYSLKEPRYFRQHFIRPMLNFNAPILLKSKPFLILY